MKVLLLSILFLTTLQSGFSKTYWSCMQLGYINDTPVMLISKIVDTLWNNSKQREEIFAKFSDEKLQLNNGYEPLCTDYSSEQEALKHEKQKLNAAKKHGFKVILLEFPFILNESK